MVIICGIDPNGDQGEAPICCLKHAQLLANKWTNSGELTWWEIIDMESGLTVDSLDRQLEGPG